MALRILGSLCTFAALSVAAKPYSVLMADSVIARNTTLGLDASGAPKTDYQHGVIERALEMVYNATGDSKYYAYQKWGVDNIIDSAGKLLDYSLSDYILDDLRLGQEFLYLWLKTGEAKYKTAANTLRNQLNTQPRNKDGGFWHKLKYPNQMWLDGQYMALPFFAQHTALFAPTNLTALSDIVLQFTDLQIHALNRTSGLLDHGYDASHVAVWADHITGASPHEWIRAMGWYTMALLDVLDYFPKSHPGYAIILGYFKALMPAVVAAADPVTGGWWLVMDQPGRAKNYIESSGTAMFVYSLLKGVRVGFLDKKGGFVEAAEKAYEYMLEAFVVTNEDGTLDWEGTVKVGSLDGAGDYDYYVGVPLQTNDPKGVAAFIFASVEYEQK